MKTSALTRCCEFLRAIDTSIISAMQERTSAAETISSAGLGVAAAYRASQKTAF
jgi:hypothetical protein